MSTDISRTAAKEINRAHQGCLACASQAIKFAMKAGELLAGVKAALTHGEFGDWIEQNCKVSLRSAQVYMQIYNNRDKLQMRSRSALLTIDDALKTLAPPVEKPVATATPNTSDSPGRAVATQSDDSPADDPEDDPIPFGKPEPARTATAARQPIAARTVEPRRVVPPALEPEPAVPVLDGLGQPVTDPALIPVFKDAELFDQGVELLRQLSTITHRLMGDEDRKGLTAGAYMERQQFLSWMNSMRFSLKGTRPFSKCLYPHGRHKCEACQGLNFVNKSRYDATPREYKKDFLVQST